MKSGNTFFLIPFFFLLTACDDSPRNYENVVIEREKTKKPYKYRDAISEGSYQMNGPIAIREFRAKLVFERSPDEFINIYVPEQYRSDTANLPLVKHGRNQMYISGSKGLEGDIPVWNIQLPDSFEINIDALEAPCEATDLTGVFTYKNQSGDIQLNNCSGAFDLLSRESDIKAMNTQFFGRSKVTAGSGDVKVSMAADLIYETEISSGGGSVYFSTEGRSIQGSVKIIAKSGINGLKTDFEPDSSGVFTSSGLEIEYEFQRFRFDSLRPEISLSSGDKEVIFSKSVSEF